jgi:hypothetical protein
MTIIVTFSSLQNAMELLKMIGALDGNENLMIEERACWLGLRILLNISILR